MSDYFSEFPYTNVVLFDKALNKVVESNTTITLDDESGRETLVKLMFKELCLLHNSYVDETDTEEHVLELLELSQKELKHLIEVYTSEPKESENEDDSDVSEGDTEESYTDDAEVVDDEVVEEINSHLVSYLDEEIDSIIDLIDTILDNPKSASKKVLIDALGDIRSILNK